MVALAKVVDILVGFIIGKLSDATKTSFGRRKPYMLVMWPLGCGVMLLFTGATQVFDVPHREAAECSNLPSLSSGRATCDALQACLKGAIANGSLLAPNATDLGLTESTDATSGEQAYFLVLYMLYFTFVVSGTQIPYDALGQELAENYDDRAKLFTVKPIFNLVGLGIGSQVLATIMSAYPQDYAFACFLCFAVLSSVFALTYLLVMCARDRRIEPETFRMVLPLLAAVASRMLC